MVGGEPHDLIPLSSISRPLIPHPVTVGSILSAALVEQDDNASFVDTDRLSSLIHRTSCSRQATFFKSCRKKINFFEGGDAQTYIAIVCVAAKDIVRLRAKNIVFCTCLRIHVSLCPSKFQNLSQITLKICGVWKNRGV